MKVLNGCEESQKVTIAMRKLGIEAYSCDTEPCSGGFPEWHLRMDIFEAIDCGTFKTQSCTDIYIDKWDLGIFFPPCTHLAVSGASWFEEKKKDGRQQKGIDFFMSLTKTNIAKWAIENPVGIMSTHYRKPDQYVQPYMFGDPFSKKTCLWLNGLPPLIPTNIVDKGEFITYASGRKMPAWYAAKWGKGSERSKTFPGIAQAMASQWSY